jgi:cytochrome o ubiquinol oxidase subunit 2
MVAAQQGHLIVASTVLMLLIVVPVIALTVIFAWRYRQSNSAATYAPDWDHSTQLELVIWAAPLLIIIALGALTWISAHTLDPYRPLRHVDASHAVRAGVKPLTIEVVALDWKWLFIYPEQGIAVVNEVAAPVDVPINFKITASSVMNSFFVPALAGQIYAMPGMQTQLNAVINRPGDYEGFSANYSGAGFSGMHFKFRGLSAGDFEHWVQSAKTAGRELSNQGYLQLEKPSEREPVRRYSLVSAGLYDAILNQCVTPCPN